MDNLPIEERVRYYFLAMGAQPNTEANEFQSGLSFILGQDRLHVTILKPNDLMVRNRIIETILGLSSRRTSTQLVYLAAPRLLGATMDATVFRLHGIGLLLFDERRIDEAVAAQLVQIVGAKTPANNESALSNELISLKAMYGEMQRNLAQLKEDMQGMKHVPADADRLPERAPVTITLPSEPAFHPELPTPSPDDTGLPSYFTNNPWLQVLSKRGRSEN